jgi:hypothetical protein
MSGRRVIQTDVANLIENSQAAVPTGLILITGALPGPTYQSHFNVRADFDRLSHRSALWTDPIWTEARP